MSAPPSRVPAPVRRFVRRTIGSLEELEVMLLLHRAPGRYWDASNVADYLGLRTDRAAVALERLAGHGLLDVHLGETIKFRFRPASDEQTHAVQRLGDLWRDSREDIIREITRTRSSLSDFSDAFRIGRDDDHG